MSLHHMKVIDGWDQLANIEKLISAS